MGTFRITKRQRLTATLLLSTVFFITELTVGFITHSLALIADAFHYLSDILGIVVALVAVIISERSKPAPKVYTFGWQRATLLGAFFNGVFLLALGLSILVQAIERFVSLTHVEHPKLVLIVGCIGLGLNIFSIMFLHEHDHDHGHSHGHDHSSSSSHDQEHMHAQEDSYEIDHALGDIALAGPQNGDGIEARQLPESSAHHEHKHKMKYPATVSSDLGMLAVLVHVIGDAINNIGVIISAVIIWQVRDEKRYYADPAIGVFIALMIIATSVPLTRRAGGILLQIAPGEVDVDHVKHDIEKIPGVESVHELHVWRLDQKKSIASAHVVVDGSTVESFTEKAKIIMECLHDYGIHSATLQPETSGSGSESDEAGQYETAVSTTSRMRRRRGEDSSCQLTCSSLCDGMRCCNPVQFS